MKTEEEVEILLEGAQQYIDLAMEHLLNALPEPESENFESKFDQKITELFVHYLFPNLDDYERALLMTIRRLRSDVNLGINTNQTEFTLEQKRHHEKLLTEREAAFILMKEAITQLGLLGKLTPSQRQILEIEFYTIEFATA